MVAAWPFGGLLISVAMAACNGPSEPGAKAAAPAANAPQAAPVRREGNLIVVPEGSPLRERLQVAEIALQPLQTRLSAPPPSRPSPKSWCASRRPWPAAWCGCTTSWAMR
jgi:cobalt-zinc-cadmium efflux system membrane fusion protein